MHNSDIRTHGLNITGFDELTGQIWLTCPVTFLYCAKNVQRLGKIYMTGVMYVFELQIAPDFNFDYALGAVEADIEYWSEPGRYRKLIDGLVMPNPVLMSGRGTWN